jgi:hypothetical protein
MVPVCLQKRDFYTTGQNKETSNRVFGRYTERYALQDHLWNTHETWCRWMLYGWGYVLRSELKKNKKTRRHRGAFWSNTQRQRQTPE